MTDTTEYTPPKVWTWEKPNGGQFANVNRPTAGSREKKELPIGRHPIQLYSMGTPNGVKVTIMLEELLVLGHIGAEYDAWLIRISEGDQFGSDFVEINPNSKIPEFHFFRVTQHGFPFHEMSLIVHVLSSPLRLLSAISAIHKAPIWNPPNYNFSD